MARVALVTGGVRGIGAAIALALRDAGCHVAANYFANTEKADAFAHETGIRAYRWDVGDFAACRDGIAAVEADLGPIDVLVNNAGITRDRMLHRMNLEDWQEVLGTNLDSLFNMSRHVIEGMRARDYGRIINISSVNGQKGQLGQANYAAAKAGVFGFTKALALEGARKNITVNAIAPGYVETDMVAAMPPEVVESIKAQVPIGRLGTAADIARCVVFLAAEEAGFITGATLSVNGGQVMTG
jgi:acetoacetyl-CoA reductase